ncbi:MAG: radical SAM protein [Candidatus Bathyarchaeota archaeon]
MTSFKNIITNFLKGHRRTAVFAITSRCNCSCYMCDLHRQEPQQISLEDAKKVLDFLAKNKFLIVYFTGGEPTLHPNVVEIVDYANRLGLVATMTTNGTPKKELLMRLKNAGLYLLSVSLDHWDAAVCEKIRNHKGIMAKQVETLKYLNEIGLRTYALSFLNSFLVEDGVEKLVKYVNNVVGVPFGFCYPTTSDINTYRLGGSITQTKQDEKLRKNIEAILKLKKEKCEVTNLATYIEDIINLEDARAPNFSCRGGEDVVYIDWLGEVYPCFLKGKLFNVLKDEEVKFLKNVRCNDCLINCFREPSLLPQIFSPKLLAKEVYYSYSTKKIYR